MPTKIISYQHPPKREAVDAILCDYYENVFGRVASIGVVIDPSETETAIEDFWTKIDQFLPPNGRLYLARNENWELVGIGMLKKIRSDAGEMKRLYVRPAARGTGLGRKLIQARIDDAREMGLKKLYADTLKTTIEMQGLYSELGFKQVDLYPESAAYNQLPQFVDALMFFGLEL